MLDSAVRYGLFVTCALTLAWHPQRAAESRLPSLLAKCSVRFVLAHFRARLLVSPMRTQHRLHGHSSPLSVTFVSQTCARRAFVLTICAIWTLRSNIWYFLRTCKHTVDDYLPS